MFSEQPRLRRGGSTKPTSLSCSRKGISYLDGRALKYPADRCRIIADAMIAFQVAIGWQMATWSFRATCLRSARSLFPSRRCSSFRFDFREFLPRHLLPALIVEHFQDIAEVSRSEVVWQTAFSCGLAP